MKSTPGRAYGRRITTLVVVFELGLGLLGILAAFVVGHPPLATLRFTLPGVLWGLAGTLPLVGLLPILDRIQFAPIRRIRAIVKRYVVPLFQTCTKTQLAMIGMSAGLAEEIAFRGFLQAWLIDLGGTGLGIVIASLAFGALHLVTPGYGVLAAILGAYMGIMHVTTGNLLVPIIIHGVYDVIALWRLVGDRNENRTLSDHTEPR